WPIARLSLLRGQRHAVGNHDELFTVLWRIEVALPTAGSPWDDAVFEVEQIHRIGRTAPMDIFGWKLSCVFLGQIVGVGMKVIIKEIDDWHTGLIDGQEEGGSKSV